MADQPLTTAARVMADRQLTHLIVIDPGSGHPSGILSSLMSRRPTERDEMILICYDGSDDAKAAIDEAARLFKDEPVTVLTVWEPFVEIVARTTVGFGLVPSIPNPDEVDEASQKAAEKTASEGAERAAELGMNAQARCCSQTSTTARAILSQAEELGAEGIVMGSRGLSGLKSLLLGSVSHEVIQRADRTVAVVPSPKVIASRTREVRRETTG